MIISYIFEIQNSKLEIIKNFLKTRYKLSVFIKVDSNSVAYFFKNNSKTENTKSTLCYSFVAHIFDWNTYFTLFRKFTSYFIIKTMSFLQFNKV